jgi:hypothetical protein
MCSLVYMCVQRSIVKAARSESNSGPSYTLSPEPLTLNPKQRAIVKAAKEREQLRLRETALNSERSKAFTQDR